MQPAPPLESFFAQTGGDPLAVAFPGKRAVHPFAWMAPVRCAEAPALWAAMHGKGGRIGPWPICMCPSENHCLFCGFDQNGWRARDGCLTRLDAVIAQLQAFA